MFDNFIPYRYDYLEFTDSKGQKRKFDQKVGSTDWPQVNSFQHFFNNVYEFDSLYWRLFTLK